MNDKNKLGIGLFLASEAVFFLILILAFVFYRSVWLNSSGPNPADHLNPLVTGLFSLALISSSGTVWFAERSAKKGKRVYQLAGLLLTIVLGMIFLVGQGIEYASLLRSQVTISQNLFGTTFFTLTGFHALHVTAGLIMLAILLGLSVKRRQEAGRQNSVSPIALYWHFVDLVWVVIFSVIYLGTVLA